MEPMQQLQFEASWDKALAPEDRQQIVKLFDDTKDINGSGIHFKPIREAINHREDLLVTVLVHNFSDQPLQFINQRLIYIIGGKVIGDAIFTLPTLVIPPRVSMPWTFIFPMDVYSKQPSFGNGKLELV